MLIANDPEDHTAQTAGGELTDTRLEQSMADAAETTKRRTSTPAPSPVERQITFKLMDTPIPLEISLPHSTLSHLRGSLEHLLRMHILRCLGSPDVSSLSSTCRFFQHICRQPSVWDAMYRRDFVPLDEQASRAALPQAADPRALYASRYKEHRNRLHRNKEEMRQLEREMRRAVLAGKAERLLDLTQLRLSGPTVLASLFLSILLYCQKVDGLRIPYWACALPLAFSLVYLLASTRLLAFVQGKEFAAKSIWKGLWPHMRGPLVSFYQVGLGEAPRLLYLCGALLCLLLVQLGLLVVKLTSAVPQGFRDELSWGMVFIPIWLFFSMFWALQCTRFRMDLPAFLATLALLWTPFLVLFVCLTVKLDYNNNGKGAIRLALVLIPFFFFEAFFMLWSAVACFIAMLRYRRGLLDRVGEHVALFTVCWGVLSPIVIFQALLCARDDSQLHNRRAQPGATEVVCPLLIVLGWMVLVAVVASSTYKTAFEDRRANALVESAGLRVIHTF